MRKTISSNIRAEVIYPAFGSEKSATTEFVNFDITSGEAVKLATALLMGIDNQKMTVRISRKKSKKTGQHQVTVTSVVV